MWCAARNEVVGGIESTHLDDRNGPKSKRGTHRHRPAAAALGAGALTSH